MNTFEELEEQLQGYYRDGDYPTAQELVCRYASQFPDHRYLLHYWRIVLSAANHESDQALKLLADILQEGFWFSDILLQSPALDTLQGNPQFKYLLGINNELRLNDQAKSMQLLTIRSEGRCLSGEPPCPLLVALHANASTAHASLHIWQAAATHGWLVVGPQSSRAIWKDAYIWDDFPTAGVEIKKHFDTLSTQYAIDEDRIVLAGESLGAELAIWSLLNNVVTACGFVAVAPQGISASVVENNWHLLDADHLAGKRAVIIVADIAKSRGDAQVLAGLLNQSGLSCMVDPISPSQLINKEKLGSKLVSALDYITLD